MSKISFPKIREFNQKVLDFQIDFNIDPGNSLARLKEAETAFKEISLEDDKGKSEKKQYIRALHGMPSEETVETFFALIDSFARLKLSIYKEEGSIKLERHLAVLGFKDHKGVTEQGSENFLLSTDNGKALLEAIRTLKNSLKDFIRLVIIQAQQSSQLNFTQGLFDRFKYFNDQVIPPREGFLNALNNEFETFKL